MHTSINVRVVIGQWLKFNTGGVLNCYHLDWDSGYAGSIPRSVFVFCGGEMSVCSVCVWLVWFPDPSIKPTHEEGSGQMTSPSA